MRDTLNKRELCCHVRKLSASLCRGVWPGHTFLSVASLWECRWILRLGPVFVFLHNSSSNSLSSRSTRLQGIRGLAFLLDCSLNYVSKFNSRPYYTLFSFVSLECSHSDVWASQFRPVHASIQLWTVVNVVNRIMGSKKRLLHFLTCLILKAYTSMRAAQKICLLERLDHKHSYKEYPIVAIKWNACLLDHLITKPASKQANVYLS